MKLRGRLVQRILSIGLSGAAGLLCATTGRGASNAKKSSTSHCETAWRNAQSRSDTGRLREARDFLLDCAKPACGSVYMQRCGTRFVQLESEIPTVVPLATDEVGAPLVDVQVKADGELVTSRLDGRGLPVDPGVHEFSFSTSDRGVFATEKVMIVEGQRNRPIAVSLHKPGASVCAAAASPTTEEATSGESASEGQTAEPSPPVAITEEPPKKGGRSVLPYLVGGVGLASIGAGALLTYWGNRDNAQLSSCSPNCVPADVTHIRALYLASDITFAAGAAALGLAGVLFFTSRSSSGEPPAHTAYVIGVQPTLSGPGALASVKGTF